MNSGFIVINSDVGGDWNMTFIFPYTLWLFNIAMENAPFIDDFPRKSSIYRGFSMAMLNSQMVLGIVIPTDELIFFRGVFPQPPGHLYMEWHRLFSSHLRAGGTWMDFSSQVFLREVPSRFLLGTLMLL